MIGGKTWALVANGGRAKIVRYLGDYRTREVQTIDDVQLRAGKLLPDRRGRSFASIGKSRSGMELHSDPVRHRERLFVEQLSEYFTDRHNRGDFDTLLLVASPRTLGDIRKSFPDALRRIVIVEADRDLTGVADAELIQMLLGMTGRAIE